MESFCDRHDIYLGIIPGEAHWKLGTCEQAVQGVKEVMTKMCEVDSNLEPALAAATMVFNQRELVRGFSPTQHLLGTCPDETGKALDAILQAPIEAMAEDPHGEFQSVARRRAEAEKAHADWNAAQRRAQNSRAKPRLDYEPGELVDFWRVQTGSKGRRMPGEKHGRFMGPARILATEKHRDADGSDGSLVRGSSVWLVRGRNLLKCCPEQASSQASGVWLGP